MPFVSLRVAGEEFPALVDTGFDGYVMLAQADINRLRLREMGQTTYRTADGQIHEGRVFQGRIEWMGNATDVAIDSTDGDFCGPYASSWSLPASASHSPPTHYTDAPHVRRQQRREQ